MNFIQPRTVAEVMTAAIGQAIEEARGRACSSLATPSTHDTIREAWAHATTTLDLYVIADPSASHDHVVEAFAKVGR